MNIEDTKMCIYQIIHWESGNSYVGQTTGKVGKRWKHHCGWKSGCRKVQNAIKKYGKDAFEFTVLEECETLDQLNEREVHWIKELNTLSPNGYNLDSGGKNKIPSEETKIKISESKRNMSFDKLQNIRNAARLRTYVPMSEKSKIETRLKHKLRAENKYRVPEFIEIVKSETSIKACLERLGFNGCSHYDKFREFVKDNNIDISHFQGHPKRPFGHKKKHHASL